MNKNIDAKWPVDDQNGALINFFVDIADPNLCLVGCYYANNAPFSSIHITLKLHQRFN